ncbi:MAG: hypothetical protein ABGX68_00990, partial [Methylococcales bacterium]
QPPKEDKNKDPHPCRQNMPSCLGTEQGYRCYATTRFAMPFTDPSVDKAINRIPKRSRGA